MALRCIQQRTGGGNIFMKAKFVELHHISYDGTVIPNCYAPFLHTLQTGLLLTLREKEVINGQQCTAALDKLAAKAQSEKHI